MRVLHCNPLQGNYRVELVHRETPAVITGNGFTEYNFLMFWLHCNECCSVVVVVLVVMLTGYLPENASRAFNMLI